MPAARVCEEGTSPWRSLSSWRQGLSEEEPGGLGEACWSRRPLNWAMKVVTTRQEARCRLLWPSALLPVTRGYILNWREATVSSWQNWDLEEACCSLGTQCGSRAPVGGEKQLCGIQKTMAPAWVGAGHPGDVVPLGTGGPGVSRGGSEGEKLKPPSCLCPVGDTLWTAWGQRGPKAGAGRSLLGAGDCEVSTPAWQGLVVRFGGCFTSMRAY